MESNLNLSGRQILIIGGAGFLGQHITNAFVESGSDVRVLDVVQAPASWTRAEWIVGSIADRSIAASAIAGCSIVVFLANASLPGSSHVDLGAEVENHVATTVKIAEACASLGVEQFLFASSGGTVYGLEAPEGEGLTEAMPTRPRNAYGVSKLAIEHYLRLLADMHQMRTLSLRIANPYGEGQRASRGQGFVAAAMQHALNGSPLPIWGDGSVERDFIHVSDVARAFKMAAGYTGSETVLNVGSGRSISLRVRLGTHCDRAMRRMRTKAAAA